MATATFRHGSPGMVDHTPESAVTAGDVIVFGNAVRIAHVDIPSGELGALADGGGVYEMTSASEVEAADGDVAYWNASTGVTRTASDTVLGKFVKAKASGETTAWIRHLNTEAT